MRIRFSCVLVGTIWSLGVAGFGESKGNKSAPEEKPSLEKRVWQLEEEIAELKRVIVELRKHLIGSAAGPPNPDPSPGRIATERESATADVAEAQVVRSTSNPNTMRVYWGDGIRMETGDRAVRLSVGGRVQTDWGFHYGAELRPQALQFNGSEFRRSRLYFSGQVGRIDFKAEYEFAGGGDVGFTDVYVGIGDIPVLGDLKLGHFKEPFGLELLTSGRFTTFMERSMGTSAFGPARNTGVMFSNTILNDRLHWAAGMFKDATRTGLAVGDGSYAFTGRLAGTLWKESDTRLLHLGVAYSHRDAVLELLRFASRPEAHLSTSLIGTGIFGADTSDRFGLEGALVRDRFSLQSEFMHVSVDSPAQGDPNFSSFYVEGSVFLTRDSRRYHGASAAFDRVQPERAFLNEGGAGAWELAARYSRLDLDDGFVLGGKEKNFTLGLNWYLNPNSKLMFNFVHADPERSGSLKVLQTRFQIDF